jgi:NADH-quinone oxidoreductase subunit I
MPIAEADVRWVEEPRLGFFDNLFLPAVVTGLVTTAKHMFMKPVTENYPEVQPDLPPNYRGVHRLNRDPEGRVKCVACYMCATACPAHCIDIVAAPSPWPDREKYPETFVIDELRCIYCGMCEEACPVDAIELTSLYDLTGMSREEMMFDKEKLLSVFDHTADAPKDPVRSSPGRLSVASEPPEQS